MSNEVIMWLGWFFCGLIASIIYYKKYRTLFKYKGIEILIFIWGYIGLYYIFWIWLSLKINKINKIK
jgi:hypothetical protein